MLPDRVSKPGPLTYESGALPIALRGPAFQGCNKRQTLYGLEVSLLVCRNWHSLTKSAHSLFIFLMHYHC